MRALFCPLISLLFTLSNAERPVNSIPVKIINYSGRSIELFWNDVFNVQPGEELKLVKQSQKPIRNDTDIIINSYNSHEFVVRFAKHDPGVQAFFTKGPGEEVVTITYNDTEKQLIATTKTKLDELVDTITSSTTDCEGFDGSKFSECVTEGIMKEISKTTNSKALMSAYRDVMSRRLVRYICEDDQLIVSNVSSTSNFVDGQMKVYIMNNLLDTTHGKIFYIENFLSENDCATIQDYHENKVSSVSDGVSTTYFDLFEADKNHPIKNLHSKIREVFLYKKIQIPQEGQEDVLITMYQSGGSREPECDGVCDGKAPLLGGRVATALLYCKEPSTGGLTVFPKADVYFKPQKYSVLFSSYLDSKEGRMDEGFMERAECPVQTGEKIQVEMHFRQDVSIEHPWIYYENVVRSQPNPPRKRRSVAQQVNFDGDSYDEYSDLYDEQSDLYDEL